MLVGAFVGPAVGNVVGTFVGPAVGNVVGTFVGPAVGTCVVNVAVGIDVGIRVGSLVGAGLTLHGSRLRSISGGALHFLRQIATCPLTTNASSMHCSPGQQSLFPLHESALFLHEGGGRVCSHLKSPGIGTGTLDP
jgi:hypothetical protein